MRVGRECILVDTGVDMEVDILVDTGVDILVDSKTACSGK